MMYMYYDVIERCVTVKIRVFLQIISKEKYYTNHFFYLLWKKKKKLLTKIQSVDLFSRLCDKNYSEQLIEWDEKFICKIDSRAGMRMYIKTNWNILNLNIK